MTNLNITEASTVQFLIAQHAVEIGWWATDAPKVGPAIRDGKTWPVFPRRT